MKNYKEVDYEDMDDDDDEHMDFESDEDLEEDYIFEADYDSSEYGNNNEDREAASESNNASIFVSKDKTVSWTTLIPNTYGRTRIENIIPNRPGITRYAASFLK